MALANRRLARSGADPLNEKRRVRQMPTFADAARQVLEQEQGGWRGRWHAQNWMRSLERYAFPRIGRRPVSEVDTADVLEILTPIWHSKAETARAVRQRIRSVLDWAIALDLRNDNPCDRVLPVLGLQKDIVTHHRALPHKEVASAIAMVRASRSAQAAVKLAFEFLVLTAARSAEVRLAAWAEMDTAEQVWTVSERMKAKREHRVPLCVRALEILDAARTLDEGNRLVFPMPSGKSISMSTLPKMRACLSHASPPSGLSRRAAQPGHAPRQRSDPRQRSFQVPDRSSAATSNRLPAWRTVWIAGSGSPSA